MLPDRIIGLDVAVACQSLGIDQDGDFDSYEINEISSLWEADKQRT